MANKISFKGIVLQSCSRKAGKNAVLSASCPYTDAIAKSMDWGDITELASSAKLEGALAAISLTIQPGDTQLKHHAFDLEQATVRDFEIVRREVEGKKDKGKRTELHFKIEASDPAACSKVEAYMGTIGQLKSTMQLSYAKQEVMFEATSEQRHAFDDGDLLQ